METIYTIVMLIIAALMVILFFKIWGMTNRVKDILNVMTENNGVNADLDFEVISKHFEKQIALAKRMIAIKDDSASKILRGIIYDIELLNKSDRVSSYGLKMIEKYGKESESLLKTL